MKIPNDEFYVVVDEVTGKFLKKTARADTWFTLSHAYQKAQTPDERKAVVLKSWDKCWTDKIGQARIFSSCKIAEGGYNLQQYYNWVDCSRVKVTKMVALFAEEHHDLLVELSELRDYAREVV